MPTRACRVFACAVLVMLVCPASRAWAESWSGFEERDGLLIGTTSSGSKYILDKTTYKARSNSYQNISVDKNGLLIGTTSSGSKYILDKTTYKARSNSYQNISVDKNRLLIGTTSSGSKYILDKTTYKARSNPYQNISVDKNGLLIGTTSSGSKYILDKTTYKARSNSYQNISVDKNGLLIGTTSSGSKYILGNRTDYQSGSHKKACSGQGGTCGNQNKSALLKKALKIGAKQQSRVDHTQQGHVDDKTLAKIGQGWNKLHKTLKAYDPKLAKSFGRERQKQFGGTRLSPKQYLKRSNVLASRVMLFLQSRANIHSVNPRAYQQSHRKSH